MWWLQLSRQTSSTTRSRQASPLGRPGQKQGGSGRVAEAPQHHAPYRRHGAAQGRDGGGDVVTHGLEAAELAGAVAHAAVVEAQRRVARGRQVVGEVHELAVAADAVLRAADDDQHQTQDPKDEQGQDVSQAATETELHRRPGSQTVDGDQGRGEPIGHGHREHQEGRDQDRKQERLTGETVLHGTDHELPVPSEGVRVHAAHAEDLKALTVAGEVTLVVDKAERQTVLEMLVTNHPQLRDLAQQPDTELLAVIVKSFLLLDGIQKASYEALS